MEFFDSSFYCKIGQNLSLEPLISFLTFLVQKLWSENNKKSIITVFTQLLAALECKLHEMVLKF